MGSRRGQESGQLDPSQNAEWPSSSSVGCCAILHDQVREVPTNIRPLLLADRGFGWAASDPIICGRRDRQTLRALVQQMPNHTGYPVDYVIRLKGDVVVQSTDYRGRLRDYRPCPAQGSDLVLAANPLPVRRRRSHQSGALLGQRPSGALVPGHVPDQALPTTSIGHRASSNRVIPSPGGADVSETDAAGAVLQEPAPC